MSQTTFLIVAGVSLALLAASGNIDGFRARPRMPQRVLSQAELQLFTTTRGTGEIVMAGSSGVVIDQGNQAIRVGTSAITFMAGTTADTEVVRIGENGNVGIGTTNSSDRLAVQGTMRLNGTSAALSLNDGNSGLTYSSTVNAFVGSGTGAKPSNGPVLFGQLDGALGTKSGGQANALYWNTTGVGIKNNAPAYALDVTGGVHATSNAVFDANVGIGNSSPAYKLDVTGGVHATSNAIFDSKVGIGTNAPGASYALDVTGAVHATSNAIFDSKVGIGNAAPGANYALDVTGNVNFTGSLYQGGSLFKTSQWDTTGSDIVYTAGKIGIGVTQPTSAIHVASGSEVNLANALVVKNVTTTTLSASTNLGLSITSLTNMAGLSFNTSTNYVILSSSSGPYSAAWAVLYANLSSTYPAGSVFTVTISWGPGQTLGAPAPIAFSNDSSGAFTASMYTFPAIRVTDPVATYTATFTLTAPTNRIGLGFDGPATQQGRLYSFSASVQSASTSTAVNVGVGTTAPTSAFHVATGSKANLGGSLIVNNDLGLTAASLYNAYSPSGSAATVTGSGPFTLTLGSNNTTQANEAHCYYNFPNSYMAAGTSLTVSVTASTTSAPTAWGIMTMAVPGGTVNIFNNTFATLTSTSTVYTTTFTLLVPTPWIGIYAYGPSGSNVVFSAFSVKLAATSNVGLDVANPTSKLQLAPGSTFDLGTAKAQWNDTGIYTATMKASGLNVNGTTTGPDANGYYTFTVNGTGGAFVYLPSSMVNGATYQVTITMRSSYATAPQIVISDGTSKNYIGQLTLTGTATTYTSSAVVSTSTQLQFYLVNPVANMTYQFKDLSIMRLDTSLSGNFGINTTNPDSSLTILGTSASPASSSLTTQAQWKTQQAIYAAGTAYALKLGAHYNAGVGAYSSIQSTEFYSGTEHPGVLSIQPIGGSVGVGTTYPYAPLHVQGITTTNTPGIGMGGGFYFNAGMASLGAWQAGWGFGLSILSRGSIACGDSIVAASDERIKKNIQPIADAIVKIRSLDVVSYDRIDFQAKSVEAGVLARNVQSILPKAVHATKSTIPNIYLKATHLKLRSGVLVEVKCDDKDIKEGSKVKLMIVQGDKEIEHESPMKNWTGSSFEVEEWKEYSEEDKVFAYGVEVDDFLNVDKEQIGILAAGAVKELLAIVEDQKGRIESLERAVQMLR